MLIKFIAVFGSSSDVGSSKIKILGCIANMPARAALCFSPSDSSCGALVAKCSISNNDKIESIAIKTVFGDHSENLFISSTKSMTGHLLGAAGGIEAVASLLSIKNNFLPPTIHYKTPDPECDLNYVPNTSLNKDIEYAMSNTFGFGGHNAVIIFKSHQN